MKRSFVLALAFAAIAAAVPFAASSRSAAPSQPAVMLGTLSNPQRTVLARIDPRTLRPRLTSPRQVIRGTIAAWTFSPDGKQIALSVASRTERFVRIVDTASLRRVRDIHLTTAWGFIAAWPAARRLVGVEWADGAYNAAVVDTVEGRVVRREPIGSYTFLSARVLPDRLVLLFAPSDGVGPATLAVLGADGGVRTATLEHTSAGTDLPPPDAVDGAYRTRFPGIAIDRVGRRAFVIGAAEPVAEVSLDTLAVTYHTLARQASLFAPLRDAFGPAAEISSVDRAWRNAQWLGNGVIAFSGSDEESYVDANGDSFERRRGAGLHLIDTRDWSVRTLDPDAERFVRAGANLLAQGALWYSGRPASGIGVVGFATDGSRRFELMRGRALSIDLVFRTYAYITPAAGGAAPRIIDVRTGTVVGTRIRRLPNLFDRAASLAAE